MQLTEVFSGQNLETVSTGHQVLQLLLPMLFILPMLLVWLMPHAAWMAWSSGLSALLKSEQTALQCIVSQPIAETLSEVRIYIGTEGQLVCIVDDGTGNPVQAWGVDITSDGDGGWSYASPIITPDWHIYIDSPTDGNLYAFADGGNAAIPLWTLNVGGGGPGTRGLSLDQDGALYMNAKDGNIYKIFGKLLLQ